MPDDRGVILNYALGAWKRGVDGSQAIVVRVEFLQDCIELHWHYKCSQDFPDFKQHYLQDLMAGYRNLILLQCRHWVLDRDCQSCVS